MYKKKPVNPLDTPARKADWETLKKELTGKRSESSSDAHIRPSTSGREKRNRWRSIRKQRKN